MITFQCCVMLLLVACERWRLDVFDAGPERTYFPVRTRFGNYPGKF